MAAYGAVVSLKNTIHNIRHSCRLSLVDPSDHILQLVYDELHPLQDTLERLDKTSKSLSRKKVNALDARINERLHQFEDLLSHQILSQIKRGDDEAVFFSIDLRSLRDGGQVPSFIQELKDMDYEHCREVKHMPKDDDGNASLYATISSTMTGLSDQFQRLKSILMEGSRSNIALLGMAGVGKTTLAKRLFEDAEVVRCFERREWVGFGRNCQCNEVLKRVRPPQDPDSEEERVRSGKKLLVVLDDVWEARELEILMSCYRGREATFLVTARDRSVVTGLSYPLQLRVTVVRFLSEEESKDLLCRMVFDEKTFPPQLDKAATKIAKKCEGLPLLIVTVGGHISRSKNRDDPRYWNDVAENRNPVFMDSYDEISKVLFPSYNYLPQHLKAFFLFLGLFPQDYDIPPSKIINMLTAEGWFLDSNKKRSFQNSVEHCLEKLQRVHNLVLANKKSMYWHHQEHGPQVNKNCPLHSSWRHLCRGEARKSKFFHVLNRLVDADSDETMKGQLGLCLENNMLFGIKDFCKSVQRYSASSTRFLLFFGLYHQYPIPVRVEFKLLRELDAVKLRFYTFPAEIQLKLLALTCNGEVPATISKLFNLRVLIIHPHMRVRHLGAPPSIPVQIWDMQELEHIEILGRSLIAPKHVASLEMLSTLVGVKASISTISELYEKVPNIRKLGVEVELTPSEDKNDLLSFFHCSSTLGSLKTLKCNIINPVMVKYGSVTSVPSSSTPSSLTFPHGLVKLHLSGIGFPWEDMDAIGTLPFLQVLKLRSYAFRGSKWETNKKRFLCLKFLLIEDSDLVQWKPRPGSFSKLCRLSMKHCYKLEEFIWPGNAGVGMIELLDCNPRAAICAKTLGLKDSSKSFVLKISDKYQA